MNSVRHGLGFGLAAAVVVLSTSAAAQVDTSDRRFYISPMFTYTLADQARGTDDGLGGTIAVGKRLTKGLDLEVLGFYSQYDTKQDEFSSLGPQPNSARLYGGGLGANILLFPSSASFLNGLYLHADVMRGQGLNQPGKIRDYSSTIFDAGFGYDLPLNITLGGLFAPGMALRLEALYRNDGHGRGEIGTNFNGDQKYFTEAAFNVGLRIPLGGRVSPPATPPPEQPPQVVPVEQPAAAPAPPPPPPPPPCQPPAPGQPINLEGCKVGETIVLRGVNFEFNKATLTVNAKTLLDQVADALLSRPDIKVEIDGHTDGVGSAAYNQKLSERRAEAVKQYLVGRGIDAGRMTTKGFGKTKPIADNSTEEGRELNRRVELKVTESNPPAGGEAAPAAGEGAAESKEAAPEPSSGGEVAPAAGATGGEAAPASGESAGETKEAAPAPSSGGEAAPPAGNEAAPPADQGSTPSGGESAPPSEGNGAAPAESAPPPADSGAAAPGDNSTPPSGDAGAPSADTSATPSSETSAPPSDGSAPPQ